MADEGEDFLPDIDLGALGIVFDLFEDFVELFVSDVGIDDATEFGEGFGEVPGEAHDACRGRGDPGWRDQGVLVGEV